jgi:hypothetical protein
VTPPVVGELLYVPTTRSVAADDGSLGVAGRLP